MEFQGKLYGKIGNKHFDTGKTSKDFDDMVKMLQKAKSTISRLKNSMRAHPDYEEHSEFADYVELAEQQEYEIELLTKITEK